MPKKPESPGPSDQPDNTASGTPPLPPGADRLPPVLPDIPCMNCQQYARCIQLGRCLGPAAGEPRARGQGETPQEKISGNWRIGKGDPWAAQHAVGVPYLEGGGGISKLTQELMLALGEISSIDLIVGETFDNLETQTLAAEALLEGTQSPEAEAMLGHLFAADAAGMRVSQTLNRALQELGAYQESLVGWSQQHDPGAGR